MQHDPPIADGSDSHPFPQPELDDPEGRSPRRLEVVQSDPTIRANRRVLRQVALCALKAEGLRYREVTVGLLDPAEMRRTNREFHGQDEPTDHLGFQYEAPEGEVSGDILVCPEVCAEQSADYGETPRRELARVVIHGVLHLGGWRDDTPSRRRRMRAREDEVLGCVEQMTGPAAWLLGGHHAG